MSFDKFTPLEDQFFLVVHFSKNNASSFFYSMEVQFDHDKLSKYAV
jgi:hypothetical protein